VGGPFKPTPIFFFWVFGGVGRSWIAPFTDKDGQKIIDLDLAHGRWFLLGEGLSPVIF